MAYQHAFVDGSSCDLPAGKVVCVGRNYAEHAKELNNPIPSEPILFIKPSTSLVDMTQSFSLPVGHGCIHFETELALLIGKPLTRADEQAAAEAIVGVGLALDMTLRDLQSALKEKGQPWEKAKAFDGSCPVSAFVKPDKVGALTELPLRLTVNGEIRQDGSSSQMLNPIVQLISHISQWFTLQPGDIVLTGTPAGVGEAKSGDELLVELPGHLAVNTRII
ncbi:fumarylacetoacetate hydrolase family protein [Nitrincola alkalilacustris]|uniref:fumarylacetoacetate hydrolase family protein n=1 Tax=Nitrincola alkalilacustris TaxID=1571224 RepID=UPI00124BFADE|nr:fumarylacetoacetate hydrolase family protein [Nitrincola alkalilacustris]